MNQRYTSNRVRIARIVVLVTLLFISAIVLSLEGGTRSPTESAFIGQTGFYPPIEDPTPTPTPVVLCNFYEEFESISNLLAQGWITSSNNSQPVGTTPDWLAPSGSSAFL